MKKSLPRLEKDINMKYKVKILPSLAQDINRISESLEGYPDKAKRLFKEMDEKLSQLEDMPRVWPVFHARPKYRKMLLEDHLLFYTVDDTSCEVKAYRILHYKMNTENYLYD